MTERDCKQMLEACFFPSSLRLRRSMLLREEVIYVHLCVRRDQAPSLCEVLHEQSVKSLPNLRWRAALTVAWGGRPNLIFAWSAAWAEREEGAVKSRSRGPVFCVTTEISASTAICLWRRNLCGRCQTLDVFVATVAPRSAARFVREGTCVECLGNFLKINLFWRQFCYREYFGLGSKTSGIFF